MLGFRDIDEGCDHKESHAVFTGTFDPPTNGHKDILRQALRIFDRVTFMIAVNPSKGERFLPIAETIEILEGWQPGVRESVVTCEPDALAPLRALDLGVSHIIRGFRTAADIDYELTVKEVYGDFNPDMETVFLAARKELSVVSSSAARAIYGKKGWMQGIQKYLDKETIVALVKHRRPSCW